MGSKITVIGAGTMGHGIAQVAAAAGYTVSLTDAAEGAAEKGLERIDANLRKGIERGKVTEEQRRDVLARISPDADLDRALGGAALVIEAIVENLEVKQELFGRIEKGAPADAVLASNTSSLPLAKIATAVATPDRVIGMHFFNPVHIMKLIEVVVHEKTGEAARAAVLDTAQKMGKEAVVVRDVPGFATSRLGVVLGLEAMRMVEQEVASAQDIDKAMELGYRHPMGPLKLTDLVGLDVRLAIAETLHRELGGEQYRPPDILRRMVEKGELGKKSGKGFYDWS